MIVLWTKPFPFSGACDCCHCISELNFARTLDNDWEPSWGFYCVPCIKRHTYKIIDRENRVVEMAEPTHLLGAPVIFADPGTWLPKSRWTFSAQEKK